MSRLSTALSNRLTLHYLRVNIFMSTPLPSTQKHKNEKMTHLAKSSLPINRRFFLRTNQLFCFRFHIVKVIRQTYTHTCMHTNVYIYRDIHTFLHTCMNLHTKQAPLYLIDHRQWENDIHSFIPDISIAPILVHYYSEALPTTAIDTVSEFTRRALQATVSKEL